MGRSLDVQTYGSLLVIGAFAASEGGAHLLAADPGSAFAWYLNVELFRPFEAVRAEMAPLGMLFGPGSLAAALCLIGLTIAARRREMRLAVATVANLSFLFSLALASSAFGPARPLRTASLSGIGGGPGIDAALIGAMLIASFAGFAMSHLSFVRAISASGDAGARLR